MAKLGIIVDSSSGVSSKEAKEKGWGFLPLAIFLNDKEYLDGENLSTDEFYSKINLEMDVRTSFTPIETTTNVIKEFSEKFDHVLVYTLSKNLSAQFNNVSLIARVYPNVHVVDSHGVGQAIMHEVERFEELYNSGKMSFEELKKYSDEISHSQYGLNLPYTMDWLVKGGRVSGTAAAMAKLFNIQPIIRFSEGKLDKHGKGKKFEKTLLNSARELKEKFNDVEKYEFVIYHALNNDIKMLGEKLKEIIGDFKLSLFPPVIACHVGVGSIVIIAHRTK